MNGNLLYNSEDCSIAAKSLVYYVLRNIPNWNVPINDLWGDQSRCFLTGSLVSGNFTGPKTSHNPNQKQKVIEADVFVLVPDNIDPHEEHAWETVARITDAHNPCFSRCSFWDPDIVNNYTMLYNYPKISMLRGHLAEIEFSIMRTSCIENADPAIYWKEIFSLEEREWLRKCRILARIMGSSEEIMELKNFQLKLARTRLLTAFASGGIRAKIPAIVDTLIKKDQIPEEPKIPVFSFFLPNLQ